MHFRVFYGVFARRLGACPRRERRNERTSAGEEGEGKPSPESGNYQHFATGGFRLRFNTPAPASGYSEFYSSRFARSPYPRGTPQSKFRRLGAYPGSIPAHPTNQDKAKMFANKMAKMKAKDGLDEAQDGQD